MNTVTKLGVFAAGLAVVFGGAYAVGATQNDTMPRRYADYAPADAPEAPAHGGHAHEETGETAPPVPGGLRISQDGYRLRPVTTTLKPGKSLDFAFHVLGPDGKPVTAFQLAHEKKLHLIVAPRDLGGFQHLHPELASDGTWTIPLTLPEPGTYRMYADFAPEGGPAMTLGADLTAPGDFRPDPFPATSRTSTVDGYTVTLQGAMNPGQPSPLSFTVSKDGQPIKELEPYLGAQGHLVALRAGDLAYLHVHPMSGLIFMAQAPREGGSYRLFFDFKHGGTVRTASFTLEG
ncbi:hypothetical protein [Herbidospora mongoliensis]|uniref:hypothetical protein n=1 Tax=Herbidospora mongoliensis TaxID=688067 RepID=UPI00082C8405|nr:hypothetical protein [Herbidospora mongoliensis]